MSQSIKICANPYAGSFNEAKVEGLASLLRGLGHDAELIFAMRPGHIYEIALSLPKNVGVFVIHGGDGSVNEALFGLSKRPGEMPYLCIMPGGSANIVAHELKLFRSNTEIAEKIKDREFQEVFYATANERPFLLMCSVGADAQVVHSITATLKKKYGKFAYLMNAFTILYKKKPNTIDILIDNHFRKVCSTAIITKSAMYGGPYLISKKASILKNNLEAILLEEDSLLTIILKAFMLFVLNKDFKINRFPGKYIQVTSASPIPVQIDGEPHGYTPVLIKLSEKSLRVI